MNWQTERIKELESKVRGLEKVNVELTRRLAWAESKLTTADVVNSSKLAMMARDEFNVVFSQI